jgi:hypothetical protein
MKILLITVIAIYLIGCIIASVIIIITNNKAKKGQLSNVSNLSHYLSIYSWYFTLKVAPHMLYYYILSFKLLLYKLFKNKPK